MNFNARDGIGRFGMGMKTAALSMSPVMELYSWQTKGATYNMTLDLDAIGKDRRNLIDLPEPTLLTDLPSEVADLPLPTEISSPGCKSPLEGLIQSDWEQD